MRAKSVKSVMRKQIFLALFFIPFWLLSQESGSGLPDSLAQQGRLILESPEYAVRDSVNRWFGNALERYVKTEAGYDDELKAVTNMLSLRSDDNRFRIFTWQMPDENFQYKRFGLVAVQTEDQGIKITRLEDKLEDLPEPIFTTFRPKEWPGAIYYEILPEGQKDNYYTLLGFAMGEPVNRKIVEVIEVDDRGRVRFGGKLFRVEDFMDKTYRKPPMRLILSYSSKYSASVKWNAEEEKIIMDHLAPPQANMKGFYQMYGPDFTYDALYWDDGWWHLERDVKFNTGQPVKQAPPPKPDGLPE